MTNSHTHVIQHRARAGVPQERRQEGPGHAWFSPSQSWPQAQAVILRELKPWAQGLPVQALEVGPSTCHWG